MRRRPHRYPVAELLDAWPSNTAAAAALGVDRRQVHRWRNDGAQWFHADRITITVGRHPAGLWPDWIDQALTDPAVTAA